MRRRRDRKYLGSNARVVKAERDLSSKTLAVKNSRKRDQAYCRGEEAARSLFISFNVFSAVNWVAERMQSIALSRLTVIIEG